MDRREGGMMPCDRRSTNKERQSLGSELRLNVRQCRKRSYEWHWMWRPELKPD